MSQTPSAGCRCAHTAQRGVLYCSELAQRGTSTAATLQILKEALANDNNNPALLKLWFKGSTLKLLPGLVDCEKIKWSTLPLWMIFRFSRNIFYTSTAAAYAFLVHNYLDRDFAFWNQGLHCHFQSEVVFCFCLLDNKCSLLAGSNLIAQVSACS